MSVWIRLAEAVGLETEANWDKAAKQRNMQRYGSQDRRDNLGPMAYFNTKGTGMAQGARKPIRPMGGPVGPGKTGMQIPSGTDRPGQVNPLAAPPARGPSPLGTAANSPQRRDSLAAIMDPDDDTEL